MEYFFNMWLYDIYTRQNEYLYHTVLEITQNIHHTILYYDYNTNIYIPHNTELSLEKLGWIRVNQ